MWWTSCIWIFAVCAALSFPESVFFLFFFVGANAPKSSPNPPKIAMNGSKVSPTAPITKASEPSKSNEGTAKQATQTKTISSPLEVGKNTKEEPFNSVFSRYNKVKNSFGVPFDVEDTEER